MRNFNNGNTRAAIPPLGTTVPNQSAALRLLLFHSFYELIEPVMRLLVDILTALILGFTFVVQSISVLISLHHVIYGVAVAIFTSFSRLIYSTLTLFLTSEREKKAMSHAFLDFWINILWSVLVYPITRTLWARFAYSPMCYAFLQVHITFALFLTRLETDISDILLYTLVFLLIIGLMSMVCYSVYTCTENDSIILVFLLKANIDLLYRGIEVMIRSTLYHLSNGEVNSDDQEHVVTKSIVETAKHIFWLGKNYFYYTNVP